jgi:hypothetical protein
VCVFVCVCVYIAAAAKKITPTKKKRNRPGSAASARHPAWHAPRLWKVSKAAVKQQ